MACFKGKSKAGKAFMLSRVRWAWARSCRSKSKFVGSAPGVGCNWRAAEKGDAYARLLPPSSEILFARGVSRSPNFVRTGPVGESSRGLGGEDEEGGGARPPVRPTPAGKRISRGVPLKGCLELSSCSSECSGEDGLLGGDTYEMRTRGSLEGASCPCCSMDRVN